MNFLPGLTVGGVNASFRCHFRRCREARTNSITESSTDTLCGQGSSIISKHRFQHFETPFLIFKVRIYFLETHRMLAFSPILWSFAVFL